jgi:hypothetical protein
VLCDQGTTELRLSVDEPKAILFERAMTRTGSPELLPLAYELADPVPQRLDICRRADRENAHHRHRVARDPCRLHVERWRKRPQDADELPTERLWRKAALWK